MKRVFLGVFGLFTVLIFVLGVTNQRQFEGIEQTQEKLNELDALIQRMNLHRSEIEQETIPFQFWDSLAKNKTTRFHFWEKYQNSAFEFFQDDYFQHNQVNDWKSYLNASNLPALLKSEEQLLVNLAEIGSQNNGLIGQMRKNIHQFEAENPTLSAQILSLRRHEKDFLMRNHPFYKTQFTEEIKQFPERCEKPELLENYVMLFNQITEKVEIVNEPTNGTIAIWRSNYAKQLANLRAFRRSISRNQTQIIAETAQKTAILNGSFFCISIVMMFVFSSYLARWVTRFEQIIQKYIATGYANQDVTVTKIPNNEFGNLMHHFGHLVEKINKDVHTLEDRVARRTETLRLKNEELVIKQTEIEEGMRYAQTIQRGLMSNELEMRNLFPNSSFFYQPKELVGGDFLWTKHVVTDHQDLRFLALADCTGHGVSGALLTVLGMQALDEVFHSKITDPGAILNRLRQHVSARLNRHESFKNRDGLAIGLVCYNSNTNELIYSGADFDLWVVRDGKIISLRGQRMQIGWSAEAKADFTSEIWSCAVGDTFLLFTDGISDQFGGISDKKWGRKGVRNWVLNQVEMMHANEKQMTSFELQSAFEAWKGTRSQTDDCAWISFQVDDLILGNTFENRSYQEELIKQVS